MRLNLKRNGAAEKELKFRKGPVYIGRQLGSQVFIPEPGVSRQHAVIYMTQDSQWVLEDLDSTNKTYLNHIAIHKSQLSDGDIVNIVHYMIEVHLDDEEESEEHNHLDETVVAEKHEFAVVHRKPDAENAPMIKMQPKRLKDFSQASLTLSRARSFKDLHRELVEIILTQLSSQNAWAGLRVEPDGPMECQGGKKLNFEAVRIGDLSSQENLTYAMEHKRNLLIPHMPLDMEPTNIRSIIIAPIIKNDLCFGALYAENSKDHPHYDVADLDYLTLLAIHTAAVLETF